MKKQIRSLINIVTIAALFFPVLFTANLAFALPDIDSSFDANNLISDKAFSNKNAFKNAAEIQDFLKQKGSPLANTSSDFIAMLREPDSSSVKDALEDPHPNLDHKRNAAELIYDSSVRAGLNPQVMLAILNKEQGLITGRRNVTTDVMQTALDHAVGYGCQGSNCQSVYVGFYNQLFGGVDDGGNTYLGATRSLMRAFAVPGGIGPMSNGAPTKVGDTMTFRNSISGYANVPATQTVTFSNKATAIMYRYDPTVFNSNYNFWKFFKEWFGTGGSGSSSSDDSIIDGLVKTSNNSDLYIIDGNNSYKLLKFVATAKGFKSSQAKKISSSSLKRYTYKGLYQVPDNTLIKVGKVYYVFQGGIKRLIPESSISGLGLNIDNALTVSSGDADLFVTGSEITISEGAVLKTESKPDVYLLSDGKLKLFTYATFVQYGAAASLQIVSEDKLKQYPKEGLVLPKPGSLVKAFNSSTVYFYEDGKKKPMDGEIFRNRGWSFANVFELTDEVINALPLGPFPLPTNNTFFNDKKTGQLYWYTDGKLRTISAFVAKQKGITPDFAFGEDTINNLPKGTPVLPKEGTVFKSDKKADVYIINSSLAFPMTGAAFTARGITPDQVNTLPQAEVDAYPKGALLTK